MRQWAIFCFRGKFLFFQTAGSADEALSYAKKANHTAYRAEWCD